jgi:hypothetical protein
MAVEIFMEEVRSLVLARRVEEGITLLDERIVG